MKALFLMFHGFDKANGISKKIHYQVKALKECGLDVRTCYYQTTPNGERRWIIDDEVIADFGTGFTAKIWKRVYYSPITEYVRREKIEFIYMRSFHNASPFTLQLVRKLKRMGAKVVMEIPTYPYDQEYVAWSMKFNLAIDRCFRHRLAKELDGIVTFSNAEHIFGGKTIRISNGIDFEAIPIKRTMNDTSRELHLIGVAEVHYWHGFDRLIHGLAEYYRTNPEYKVYFHIVGPLSGIREQEEILPAIRDNHLEPYVILHGPLHSDKLDEQFEKADFAIGSLGRHRSGITSNCILEHNVQNIVEKYCESSIFVLSSRFEGFGMVIIEAMACGVPPVSFTCPCGPKDIITDGKDGLLVENGDIEGLADKICYLIEHEDVRRKMGIQARTDVERFKIEHIAREWKKLFETNLSIKY